MMMTLLDFPPIIKRDFREVEKDALVQYWWSSRHVFGTRIVVMISLYNTVNIGACVCVCVCIRVCACTCSGLRITLAATVRLLVTMHDNNCDCRHVLSLHSAITDRTQSL